MLFLLSLSNGVSFYSCTYEFSELKDSEFNLHFSKADVHWLLSGIWNRATPTQVKTCAQLMSLGRNHTGIMTFFTFCYRCIERCTHISKSSINFHKLSISVQSAKPWKLKKKRKQISQVLRSTCPPRVLPYRVYSFEFSRHPQGLLYVCSPPFLEFGSASYLLGSQVLSLVSLWVANWNSGFRYSGMCNIPRKNTVPTTLVFSRFELFFSSDLSPYFTRSYEMYKRETGT